jgi:recombination protein RecT
MTNEIVKQKVEFAVGFSNKFRETPIAQGLVKHGKEKLIDKILSNFYFLARKVPTIPGCTQQSIVESITKCCQWELVPDGIQACLIAYGKELTFQPMYQGLLEVAYRTGIFKSIVSSVVYKGDLFEYDIGGDCYVKHQLDLEGDRDVPIAVYADIRLINGGRLVRVMTMKEVEKIKVKAKNKTVWNDYPDAMRVKTVIKQAFKLCPKSEDLSSLVAHDNALEQDFDRLPDNTKANALNALLGNGAAPEQLPEPELDDADLDNQIEEENRKELENKS